MMYVISRGQVPAYGTDLSRLVYLVTTVETLLELGHHPLFTRRNAALVNAHFVDDVDELNDHIDWPLMREQYWNDTDADGDRKARRMAECLVHHEVGWSAFHEIGVFDDAARARVVLTLTTLKSEAAVRTHRDWYY